jgi:hypothetical protein
MLEETWNKNVRAMPFNSLKALHEAIKTRGDDQKWLLEIIEKEVERRHEKTSP